MKKAAFLAFLMVFSAVAGFPLAVASTTTANMSLVVPSVGDTDYPTSISSSMTLIDAHDHSSGKGVTLGTNAVPTAAIQASAVTTAKIADSNVTTAKIADSNVTTAKIADSNVTTAKIADSNVTTAKIADGNVTPAKLSAVNTAVSSEINSTGLTDASFTDMPNSSVSITTNGRAVMVQAEPSGAYATGVEAGAFGLLHTAGAGLEEFVFQIVRDGSVVGGEVWVGGVTASERYKHPCGALAVLDSSVTAGAHTYKVQYKRPGLGSGEMRRCKLRVTEL